MAETARNYSDSELESVSSKQQSAKSVMNSAALRRAADKWGSAESIDGQGMKPTIDAAGQAELDVLNVLKQVRQTNPYLKQNTILEKRIEELEHAANPTERMRIQRDIGGILSTTYGQVIRDNDHEMYFRARADDWTNKIKSLSLREQTEWIKGIDTERVKRKAPFDALEKTLNNVSGISSMEKTKIVKEFHEQMASQGRRENLRYVETVKSNVEEFNNLMKDLKDLDPESKKRMTSDFLNVSTADQKAELARLKDMVDSKVLDEKFKQFDKSRQSQIPNFFSLSKREKEGKLDQLTTELINKYKDSYRGQREILTKEDIRLFEQTAQNKDISLLEACLADMPKTMRDARETFDKGKKKFEEFKEKAGKEVADRVFDSVGWNNHNATSFDRKKIIQKRQLEKVFEGEEVEKREANSKKYSENIDKHVGEGNKIGGHTLMHKKGRMANKAWFKTIETKEQNKIIEQAKGANKTGCDVGKTIEKRKKLNEEHAKLPKAVQKEFNKVYENLGMEEREALNKRITSLRSENTQKYEKQLKKAGKLDLIPDTEKARKKLSEDFDTLSLKEQTKRKERDKTIFNPQLEAAVKAFKGTFAKVPSKVFMKAWSDFQKKPQAHERIAFIRIFLARYNKEGNDDLNAELQSIEIAQGDRLTDKTFRDKMVDKTAEKAEIALENGNTKTALDLYKEASEMDPDRHDIAVLVGVLEDSEYKDAPIPPAVLAQTEDELGNLFQNDDVKDSMEMLKLLDETIYRIQLSERQHQNIKNAEGRSMDALKRSGNEEAMQLQEDLTSFETDSNKEDKTVVVKDQGEFKAKDVLKINLSSQQNDLASSESDKQEKKRELIKALRTKQGGQEGLDHVEFKDETGKTKESKEAQIMRDKMAEGRKGALVLSLVERLTKNNVPRPIAERSAKQMVERQFEKEVERYEIDKMAA